MSSPAGKFVSDAPGMGARKTDDSYQQVAKHEPEVLMRFLDFCAGKIHREQGSRPGEAVPERIQ